MAASVGHLCQQYTCRPEALEARGLSYNRTIACVILLRPFLSPFVPESAGLTCGTRISMSASRHTPFAAITTIEVEILQLYNGMHFSKA